MAKIKRLGAILILIECYIKYSLKHDLKQIFKELKNWQTLVLFLIVWSTLGTPTWLGYLLGFLGVKWGYAMATAYLFFWNLPLTPFIPICIAITLALKKMLTIRKRKDQKLG